MAHHCLSCRVTCLQFRPSLQASVGSVSQRTISHTAAAPGPGSLRLCHRVQHSGRRLAPAAADAGQSPEDSFDIPSDLLQQIEERKRLHQELLSRLGQRTDRSPGSSPPSQAPSTPAQPAAAQQPASSTAERPGSHLPSAAKPARPRQSRPDASPTPPPTQAQQHPQPPPAQQAAPPPQQAPACGENRMNICFVGSECAPWSKTGGLGDVMGALPKALARRGHRVMVVVPRYGNYAEGWETGVRRRFRVFNAEQEVGYFHGFRDGVDYVFVDHSSYTHFGGDIYGGSREDVTFRCALLCKAALEAPWHVPCGGAPYGDENLLFVANDWHTALLPFYLQAHYRDYNQMTYARSVLVIHNMAHQGRGPMADLSNLEVPAHYNEHFRLYDPIGGEHMNIMKAGLLTAHRLVAVSHGYAWECQTQEGGWGLDGVLREQSWKLRGIVNGIDTSDWSPSQDAHLRQDGYTTYDLASLDQGKAQCKAALQRELGLPERADVPLLGFIGRLDYQKGVDLIKENFHWLMDEGAQLVLLGSGRHDLESALKEMESQRYQQCRGWVGFSVSMAHRLTAGADILLMPSRFEPCGLNQLYAMEYGTVPIVHAVGGLRDTVQQFDPNSNAGTGWTFEWADSGNFRNAMGNGMYTWREHRDTFRDIQKRGMTQDLTWDNAAAQYEEVLLAGKYQW